jgi:predicted transposase/invertase (TIGR01784 family)
MKNRLVRFDWALKKLLRNKANFEILEGFFSELLKRSIIIQNILESEGNKDTADDKFNRVDMLAQADGGEMLLIELQVEGQYDYFHRMLFGVSKILTDNMSSGFDYDRVKKVISINIVYFDLGQGDDYIYKGLTEFKGIHKNDLLNLSLLQRKNLPTLDNVSDVYPEYYILKVNKFDDLAVDTLDEWIYFLKNSEIRDGFRAKGLKKAAEELDIMKLPDDERRRYESYIEDRRCAESSIKTSWLEGHEKGIEKGIEHGEKNKNIENVKNMKDLGVASEIIIQVTGMKKEEIENVV